jgi:hypothetical protein
MTGHILRILAVLGGAMLAELLIVLVLAAFCICWRRLCSSGASSRTLQGHYCLHCGEPLARKSKMDLCRACDWLADFQCFQRADAWLRSLEPEVTAIYRELRRKSC